MLWSKRIQSFRQQICVVHALRAAPCALAPVPMSPIRSAIAWHHKTRQMAQLCESWKTFLAKCAALNNAIKRQTCRYFFCFLYLTYQRVRRASVSANVSVSIAVSELCMGRICWGFHIACAVNFSFFLVFCSVSVFSCVICATLIITMANWNCDRAGRDWVGVWGL